MAKKEYLNVKDLAALAGVTPQRIRQLAKAGAIGGMRKIGRDYLISPTDAGKWLDSRSGDSGELDTKKL